MQLIDFTLVVFSLVAGVLSQAETIYLSNCEAVSAYGTTYYSEIEYYPAGSDSQNGEVPSDDNICNGGDWGFKQPITWEGQEQTCTFGTNDVVTTNIGSNGQQVNEFAWAGTASNGYKNFNCYSDTYRQLYYVDQAGGQLACYSLYWCNPQ